MRRQCVLSLVALQRLITSESRTAAAAAVAAAQLLGKAGADEMAEPPRTDLAGRAGTPAAQPLH